MSIYLIEHQVKDFTGFFGGVDFYHGQGSTSSEEDAQKLKKAGCRILEPGTIESQNAGEADASPVSISQEAPKPRAKPGRKPKAPK